MSIARLRLPPASAALIPAFNEEATIQWVASEALRYLEKVVVVDDGSQDQTSAEASRAGATVLRNAQTIGQGGSLIRGLRWMFARDFQQIVILDGDGAHDPKEILGLLHSHQQAKADLTVGSRFLERDINLPTSKRSANRFATGLLNAMFGLDVSDAASGMRVVGRRAGLLPFSRQDFAFAFEMLRCCRSAGLTVHEAPVKAHYDARELFCTNRTELLNLLDYCASEPDASRHAAVAQCQEAIRSVRNWTIFCADIGGASFTFHPLPSHRAYAIQEQDPAFPISTQPDSTSPPSVISL